jgi:hypothetical protein
MGTRLKGFYVAVRGSVEDHFVPKLFMTPKAEIFIKTVLGLEPNHLTLCLEAWTISRIGR